MSFLVTLKSLGGKHFITSCSALHQNQIENDKLNGKLDTDGDTSLKGWSLTSYSILSSWSSWRMKGLGAEWIHSMSFFFTRKVAWKKDTPYISLTILQVQIGRSCDPCQGSE